MQVEESQCQCTLNKEENEIYDKENELETKIEEKIHSIIKKEGYKTHKISKKVFKDNGNGFLGVLCEADIKGKTDDGEKETSIFLKLKTPGEKVTLLSLSSAFLRELYVYKELSRVYDELQDKYKVPENVRYKFPKFYIESDENTIVLENLCRKNFKTFDRMDVMSLEFAKIGIKELAKFHGLSFVLQKVRPAYFEQNLATIKHNYTFNESWALLIRNICSTAMKYLDEDAKKKLEKFTPVCMEMYKNYLEDDTCIRCICHGDYRPGNIMIKEEGDKVTEIIPIDYQLINYSCPIYDFLYFIFGASDQKFRRNHLEYLKDYYYQELKDFLSHFDMDIMKVLPKMEYEKLYKDRLDYGLITALLLISFILSDDDAVPDVSNGEEIDFGAGVTEEYKKRMIELVDDFIEWGYL